MTVKQSREDINRVLFPETVEASSQALKSPDNGSDPKSLVSNPQAMKVDVEKSIHLVSTVMTDCRENHIDHNDENLFEEVASMLDELKQLSAALNLSEPEPGLYMPTMGELSRGLQSRRQNVEPILSRLFMEHGALRRLLRSGKSLSDPFSTSSSVRMSQNPRMVWHPEDVQNLIYLLIDEYNARTFVDGKPKDPKLWQQIAQKLDIPDYPGISGVQVMGKVNSLKQDYKAFQFLKDQTGVGWDEEKDTVDADDGWWDLKSQANPNITKFKNKGLANYPELHLLFAYSTASGALRQSSVQRAPTPEECARRERAVRDRHRGFHNVDEEHIASGGGVNLSCGGVQSMDTSSSSRKRGSASVMGARQRRKAKPTSEELYYDEVRNFIIGRRDRDGAGSSGHSGGMKECIAALQSLNPRLPIEQFTVVVRYLTGNRDAQEAFLAMDDDIKGDWARYVK
ncbi:hypothetical protein CJ030_MR7G021971 [Morella rubra]|uniref:Myb/SANT-like domain-containing protein n=1 Tax=Morella rubra TaxID=262757 RepID=A0A6A1UY14_9ROSI|nr:hypothetical protein CJ030_MR7G021971 [Morella rubra]